MESLVQWIAPRYTTTLQYVGLEVQYCKRNSSNHLGDFHSSSAVPFWAKRINYYCYYTQTCQKTVVTVLE